MTMGAAAQTTAPPPSLQAGSPAYNISTFSDLVRLCTASRNDPNYPAAMGLCAGYISGALDYHLADTGWAGNRRNRRVCLPSERPTRMETLQSMVSWDESHRQYNSEPAVDGVMRYFMATYPCPTAHATTGNQKPPG